MKVEHRTFVQSIYYIYTLITMFFLMYLDVKVLYYMPLCLLLCLYVSMVNYIELYNSIYVITRDSLFQRKKIPFFFAFVYQKRLFSFS
jgi:hypothetical protein